MGRGLGWVKKIGATCLVAPILYTKNKSVLEVHVVEGVSEVLWLTVLIRSNVVIAFTKTIVVTVEATVTTLWTWTTLTTIETLWALTAVTTLTTLWTWATLTLYISLWLRDKAAV